MFLGVIGSLSGQTATLCCPGLQTGSFALGIKEGTTDTSSNKGYHYCRFGVIYAATAPPSSRSLHQMLNCTDYLPVWPGILERMG